MQRKEGRGREQRGGRRILLVPRSRERGPAATALALSEQRAAGPPMLPRGEPPPCLRCTCCRWLAWGTDCPETKRRSGGSRHSSFRPTGGVAHSPRLLSRRLCRGGWACHRPPAGPSAPQEGARSGHPSNGRKERLVRHPRLVHTTRPGQQLQEVSKPHAHVAQLIPRYGVP